MSSFEIVFFFLYLAVGIRGIVIPNFHKDGFKISLLKGNKRKNRNLNLLDTCHNLLAIICKENKSGT